MINDLPPTKDKFWKNGDTHVKKIETKNCGHIFTRVSGREVICDKCGMGYILDGKFYLKGMHIYYEGSFVI